MIETSEYVIKNPRLKDYLYSLGFDFRIAPHKDEPRRNIYLFHSTSDLQEAITFYTNMHNKHKQNLL